MDNHQEEFIKTIRDALGRSSARPGTREIFGSPPGDLDEKLNAYVNKNRSEQRALLDLFTKQAKLINMEVTALETPDQAGRAIRELVHKTRPEWGMEKSVIAWDHPLINQLNLKQNLSDIEVFTTHASNKPGPAKREQTRKQLIQSYMGITSADFCVAPSATLVLRTRPGQPRAVSLVPSIHVAVIRMDQILQSLEELYFRLKWDPEESRQGLTNCMTLVSGPSKTADIELVMVHGAHGPRQLLTYVITG